MRSYLGYLIVAIAIIIAVFIATTAYKYRFKSAETITATGSSETDFISDQIVWKGTFTRQGYELKPIPAAAMAAAAWSCVEKILQELHFTSAPKAIRVSINTAV